jgi:peptidoglycan/LPS O-acetylase OafA/YrhL
VTVFIAISGFCLMMPIALGDGHFRGGALEFFRRRARRILPPYYAALLLSLLADRFLLASYTHTLYDSCFPIARADIWQHLLLVQDLVPHQYTINGPPWSIAVEFQIYLFFPLFIAIRHRLGMAWVVTGTFVLSGLAAWVLYYKGISDRTPQYLFVFALGMLAAHLALSKEGRTAIQERRLLRFACLSMTLGGGAAIVVHHYLGSDKPLTDAGIGLFMCGTLLFATLRPSSAWVKALSSRVLVVVGAFSYSIYLIHLPLQQLFWQYVISPLNLSKNLSFLLVVLIGSPLVIGMAYLFFWAFERPFMTEKVSPRRERRSPLSLPSCLLNLHCFTLFVTEMFVIVP